VRVPFGTAWSKLLYRVDYLEIPEVFELFELNEIR
jgi:hypothetical protein